MSGITVDPWFSINGTALKARPLIKINPVGRLPLILGLKAQSEVAPIRGSKGENMAVLRLAGIDCFYSKDNILVVLNVDVENARTIVNAALSKDEIATRIDDGGHNLALADHLKQKPLEQFGGHRMRIALGQEKCGHV